MALLAQSTLFPLPAKLAVTDPPIYTSAMTAYPYSPALAARYKFKTHFGSDVDMAVRQGNTLLVPRETAPIAVEDHRRRYPEIAIDCNFVPRNPEQLPLADKSESLLRAGRNHIFNAPTGWGKTVVGARIAVKMGQPTLILVNKEDLIDQWRKAFINVLGIPKYMVGLVQQNVCDWEERQFVIGMVQSIVLPDRYPPEMYNYFGMVIFDEVHVMAADTFVRGCQLFPAYYRLGFSATVKRVDGRSPVLHAHIGPVLVEGTIVPMSPKILVKQTGWEIPEGIPHAPDRMALVNKMMGASVTRNAELVKFIKAAFDADRRILVLSDLREGHLVKLFHAITKAGIAGNEIGYYVGGMKKDELEATKLRRIVLGTYAMCSTGTDVPSWDTLVLASPRAHVKQAIGRVLRSMSNKKQPVILDLVDYNKVFHNFHLSRLKTYYEVKATVVQMG